MEEITIEEAMKRFGKNTKVLVATQDLEKPEKDIPFVLILRNEFDSLFSDVKTVSRKCDDFINKYDLFTSKQDILNIQPVGKRKTVLLKVEEKINDFMKQGENTRHFSDGMNRHMENKSMR